MKNRLASLTIVTYVHAYVMSPSLLFKLLTNGWHGIPHVSFLFFFYFQRQKQKNTLVKYCTNQLFTSEKLINSYMFSFLEKVILDTSWRCSIFADVLSFKHNMLQMFKVFAKVDRSSTHLRLTFLNKRWRKYRTQLRILARI